MQKFADRFAVLADMRMNSLLNLRGTAHIHDPEPGDVNSVSRAQGDEVVLRHFRRAEQPYRDLSRFAGNDRVMQHVIDRGLLPIVTTLSKEIMGKKLLVTRHPAPRKGNFPNSAIAHLASYGIRIQIHLDPATEETIVGWECLYGTA